jgi:hypothetical protein
MDDMDGVWPREVTIVDGKNIKEVANMLESKKKATAKA